MTSFWKQKRLTIVTALCILLPFAGGFAPKASADANSGATNMLVNPGFEDVTDGIKALPWRVSAAWGTTVKLAPEAAHTGSNGVSVETATNNNPWVAQLIPVEEGATYRFDGWFRSTPGATGKTGYKLEYYSSNVPSGASSVGGYAWYEAPAKMNGQWHEMSYEHVAPTGAKYVLFYLRLYGTGKVYFDDATVTKIKDKQQIRMTTGEVFYYPERTDGTIQAALEPANNDFAGKTVDVLLNDETGVTVFSQTYMPAAPQIEIAFDPQTTMSAFQSPYEAIVILRDGSGTEVERQSRTIYRWERPTSIPDGGIIQVDGEPFFPVVAYHAAASEFSYLKDIGVNTVQGNTSSHVNDLIAKLDAAEQYDLKVLVTLYNNMKVKENYNFMRSAVPVLKNHPALLGYMVMDEPTYNGIGQDELIGAYEIVRALDPDHPVYMVENQADAFVSTGQATDILVSDQYPFRPSETLPIRLVGDDVRKAITAVKDDKPVWSILQTFRTATWNYLPTIAEVRNMGYQSFLAGAKGLGFYSITDPGWRLKDSVLWPGMVAFKDEIELMRDLLIDGTKTNESIGDNVQWGVWSKGNEQYAIAINTSSQQQQASIPLGQTGSRVELLYGDTPSQFGVMTPEMEVTLAPLQTNVFRVVPFIDDAGVIARMVTSLQAAGDIHAQFASQLAYRMSIIQLLLRQGDFEQAVSYIQDFIRYINDPSVLAQQLLTDDAAAQLGEQLQALQRCMPLRLDV